MTAFNGRVTFSNQDGMLMATAYRLGEDFNVALPALMRSDPPAFRAQTSTYFTAFMGMPMSIC